MVGEQQAGSGRLSQNLGGGQLMFARSGLGFLLGRVERGIVYHHPIEVCRKEGEGGGACWTWQARGGESAEYTSIPHIHNAGQKLSS